MNMSGLTFPETKRGLQKVLNLLRCINCSALPSEEEVFFITTTCHHKYCGPCLKKLSGKNCSACKKKLNAKDAILDLFSNKLLVKLLSFEHLLYKPSEIDEINNHPDEVDDEDIRSDADMFSQAPSDPDFYMNTINTPNHETGNKLDELPSTSKANKSRSKNSKPDKSKESAPESELLFDESEPEFTFEESPTKNWDQDIEDEGFLLSSSQSQYGSPPLLSTQEKSPLKQTNCTPPRKIVDSPVIPTLTPQGLESGPKRRKRKILVANRTLSSRIKKTSSITKTKEENVLSEIEFSVDHSNQVPQRSSRKQQVNENLKVPIRSRIFNLSPKRSISSNSSASSTPNSKSSSLLGLAVRHRRGGSSVSSDSPRSVEKRNAKGETSLHVAARLGKIERVKELIEANANINARDFAGWTPLHEAINGKTNNKLEVATLLCEAGCQTSVAGGLLETPLHEASRLGLLSIVSLLLSHGANKFMRNKTGEIPRDVAGTEEVKSLLDNFNGLLVREIDPIISCTEEKIVLFFTYSVDAEVLNACQEELGVNIASEFSGNITHVIFDVEPGQPLPLTLNYLLGLVSGAWLLSSKWVVDSLCGKELLEAEAYEIHGAKSKANFSEDDDDSDSAALPTLLQLAATNAAKRARTNREMENPGLFQGINFYLYKNCSYNELKKKDLANLITTGSGVVINRDPNPDTVDPLENPTRFHAKDPSHKMMLASHVILYNPENCPTKKHNMEHVKTLKVDYLIQSVLRFRLLNPDHFLN